MEMDLTAGSLVWVRRPNGTWWPGRVLGLHELPPGCSKLPTRSGTPIKLLGKEDGSMDWYNLEKSKRVKTFRCGEYDELIEKAKDRATRTSRRSTDERIYVRREDAILHALELEKAHYFDGNHKLGSVATIINSTDKKIGLQFNRYCKKAVDMARSRKSFEKSTRKLSQSVVSFEQPDKFIASDIHFRQSKRRRTPNDSEDDTAEGMKRMRDLQDLGLGMVKSEPNVHFQTKGSSDLDIHENDSLSESNFDTDSSGDSPMNSSKDSTSSLKRKRSKVVKAYESLKKKNQHCPLQKARKGLTNMKSNSIYYHGDIGGQLILQGVENTARNKKSSLEQPDFPSLIADSSDSSGTSCEENLFDTDEDHNVTIDCSNKERQCSNKQDLFDNDFSDGFINIPVVMRVEKSSELCPTFGPCSEARLISCDKKDPSNHCIQVGVVSQASERLGDACSTGSATHISHAEQKIDMGTSEWFSKGKRNLRHQSLNKNVDLLESFGKRNNWSCSSLVNRTDKDIINSTSDESPTSDISDQLTKHMLLKETTPKISSMDDGKQDVADENGHCHSDEAVHACNSVPCAEEHGLFLSSEAIGSVMPGRMPLPHRHIRLPSRYRDSEQQVSVHSRLYDVELNVRTNYQGNRVPLVSLMSKFNNKAIVGHPITVELLENGVGHTSSINGLLKDKANKCNKSQAKIKQLGGSQKKTMVKCPLSVKKSSHGKKLGFSPRKIRRLSSLVASNKKEDLRRSLVEKNAGPAVSCIPLRLVFSRLNEALSNSARPAN